ncbi:MAG: ABC transporter permease [Lachnospiraceae bacterium]|nr:ABC transporter permease [Lachnospiraceae bacterium]
MIRYACRRIIAMIPVLIGVTIFIFALLALTPGDPATLVLGENASLEALEAWRESYGLNDSLPVQYLNYMKGLLHGDLGNSYRTGESVTSAIMQRFPTTVLLATIAVTLAIIIGLLFGIAAANHQNTWLDTILRIFGMFGISVPAFWLDLMLIIFFGVTLRILPVSGWYGPRYWILPGIASALIHAANIVRITRSSMLDNIRMDYVRTARAKGQTENYITYHHVLRNALIPIMTTAGSAYALALGGAMITEQIFSIPGIGVLMLTAINNRDYPLIRGCVIVLASTTCLVNLLVDLLYAAVDPRIKAQYKNYGKRKKKVKKEAAA